MLKYLSVISVALYIQLFFIFSAFGSDPGGDPGGYLRHHGYALTVDGLRQALLHEDYRVIGEVLNYISMKEHRAEFSPLCEDVINTMNSLDDSHTSAGIRARYIACLFVIDTDMTIQEQDKYVETIRYQTYVMGNISSQLKAFRAAHDFRGVNIKDDLYRIAETGLMSRNGVHVISETCIKALFELYGDSLTALEVEALREAWEGEPEVHDFVVEQAQRKGFLLDFHFKENDER